MVAVALAVFSCAARAPLDMREEKHLESTLAAISVPLDLQDCRIVNADGQRGVLLKLSRLPDAVEHRVESEPPRIIVDVKGPTGTETPELVYPGGDNVVSRVSVARSFGLLRVVLELQTNTPPTYSVHPMADWIMVRLAP